jgi:sodium/hydrogen antiporter
MLLNVSIFMWYGVVCPWSSFVDNEVVPIYHLVPLGVLVLIFRRLPWVFAIHKFVPQIEEVRQAIFVGFFGPVGVSAIFYLYIAREFLDTLDVVGQDRKEIEQLGETIRVVVWFLAVCSIVSLMIRTAGLISIGVLTAVAGCPWLEYSARKAWLLLATDAVEGNDHFD